MRVWFQKIITEICMSVQGASGELLFCKAILEIGAAVCIQNCNASNNAMLQFQLELITVCAGYLIDGVLCLPLDLHFAQLVYKMVSLI